MSVVAAVSVSSTIDTEPVVTVPVIADATIAPALVHAVSVTDDGV